MKKCLLTLFALFCLLKLAQAQVVVTEIMYNPPESNTDSLEYIEIYNNTNAAIDISGWSFTQGAPFTFPAGTSMPSHAYFVIARNPAPVQTLFGISNVFAWNTGEALTNSGEDIELRDAASNVIDYVDYKNVAPWPTDPAGGGSSLVLCDFNSDNSLPISWQAATTPVNGLIINGKQVYANPGAASGCTGTVTLSATNDIVVVSSGESKTIDVLFNDLLPNPVTSFTILTAPAHGTAAIANQQITYNSTNGYCGPDKITYIVCDATKCDTADVNITVKCYPTYTIAQVTGETATGTPDSNAR